MQVSSLVARQELNRKILHLSILRPYSILCPVKVYVEDNGNMSAVQTPAPGGKLIHATGPPQVYLNISLFHTTYCRQPIPI